MCEKCSDYIHVWKDADVSNCVNPHHCILSDSRSVLCLPAFGCYLFAVPSTIQPIQNMNITEGENLTLLCNTSGIPSPMVSWINVEGDKVTNKSELVLTNISRSQAGEYRCEASNQCGNASETATIEVQCK